MSVSQIPLIARAMKKNRLVAGILLLQVVIATACVTNIAFLLAQRVETLAYDTGLQEQGLGIIETEFVGSAAANPAAAVKADMQALRNVAGVKAVVAAESLPLSQHNWTVGFTNAPVQGQDTSGIVEAEPAVYGMSAGAVEALGMRLVAGRDFSAASFVQTESAQDYAGLYKASEAIVSAALARHLFGSASAVGRDLYTDGIHPLRIVGVVETLSRPVLRTDGDNDMSLLLPLIPDGTRVMYALRSEPGVLPTVLDSASNALAGREANRMLPRVQRFSELRAEYFRRDRTMAIIFLCAGVSLLIVTGTGVYGLASFWVRKRYPQIGIRRALGARRRDVVSFFMIENLMLTLVGALAGSALALALNIWVARYYEIPRIDPGFLALGVGLVFALGQLAAWVPARRAAREAPVAVLNST